MNDMKYFFICLLCMAGITYLVRMLPLVLFRKKIKSRFLQSFFYYIPYAVLAAMTLPAILYSTSSLASAAAGLCVALVLAYFEQSLIVVAAGACVIVFIFERFL